MRLRPLRGELSTHIRLATGATSTWHGCASDKGYAVANFDELQDVVAWLGYRNPAYDLYLRGQKNDLRNTGTKLRESLILPALLRPRGASARVVQQRQDALAHCANVVQKTTSRPGIVALRRYPVALWALLQHYQITPTPLIDLTRSARVAASFATLDPSGGGDRFIYVFALPYPTGNITYDFTNDLILLNLRNLMPPDARRPHYQEGYLMGSMSARYERWTDFNLAKRMIGKIRIPTAHVSGFFHKENPPLPSGMLMPSTDPVLEWATNTFLPLPV